MLSLLGYEQVSSCQTSKTAQKLLDVLSDRWITPYFLQEFQEDVFLGVGMESLLGEAEVWSL